MRKDEGGSNRPVTNNRVLICFSKTWDVAAYVMMGDDKEMAMPGEDVAVTMWFNKPMVLTKGQIFTVREGGVTVGTGKVIFMALN